MSEVAETMGPHRSKGHGIPGDFGPGEIVTYRRMFPLTGTLSVTLLDEVRERLKD